MEYRILGPVEVMTPEGPVALGGPKQRALLGVLLLNAGHVVSTGSLATALWGDEPPETAVNILQGHVGDLRRLLDRDALVTRPPGYLLRADPEQIDARRFERLAFEGRRLLASDPATAAVRLREALVLWRGSVLADVPLPGVPPEVTRLEEQRLAAIEDRIDADLALGAHAELVGELAALRAAHPSRERLCGQLMLVLYRSGRQEEALAAYRELRDRLCEELGIDPSPELQRLERSILRQEPSLLPHSSPPAVAAAPPPEAPPVAAPTAAAPPAVPRPRAPLLAAAAVMAVVGGSASIGLLRARTGPPAPPPPQPSSCPHATPAPDSWRLGPGQGVVASVAHTCYPGTRPGLMSHAGPGRTFHTVSAYDEGASIRVLCQDRHGELVTDDEKPPPLKQPASQVWDRLDNGGWISDVYTSLPKQPGDTPPLGLPTC